jgi:acyl-CoA dehydrogenase
MPLEFKRSWGDEEVERFRAGSACRKRDGVPHDGEARRRGYVGHELWRRAGELGFLCVDIPEEWGGAGGTFRHDQPHKCPLSMVAPPFRYARAQPRVTPYVIVLR